MVDVYIDVGHPIICGTPVPNLSRPIPPQHTNQIWWIRPPWADQLPDGDRTFDVGVEAASGCLRCVGFWLEV